MDASRPWRDGQAHLCPLAPQPHTALRDCVRYALDHKDETFVGDRTYVPENDKAHRQGARRGA